MSRNLVPKFILILILVLLAVLTLYPPSRTLKPGIDLAGGTSLIYAIDTEGLTADQERDLAQKMITVLRRRIDPANIQNLVWRPLGNTRFEIQMPLASKETEEKRDAFQAAMEELDKKNVNAAVIMRALLLPPDQRSAELTQFAQGDPNHLKILNELAAVHDERQQLQQTRDTLSREIKALAEKMRAAGLDVDRLDANRRDWAKLNEEALAKALTDLFGAKGTPESMAWAQTYIRNYAKLAEAFDKLTAPGGVNERYEASKKHLDQLSLTQERITLVLELPPKGTKRAEEIAKLKSQHPSRVPEIERVLVAYDGYSPFRGRLDDPADLRRMLKGAGILEFRILPTRDRPELSAAEIQRYEEALTSKGPKAASDHQYIWVEIENIEEWHQTNAVVGQFGDKSYVLASNRLPDEALLRNVASTREWKLENARPTSDEYGRRAIGFALDIKGGDLFYNITSKNVNRPLAIVLDDRAISAPNINSPIRDSGIIQGSFTPTQVSDMVDKLNAGSLPARLIDQPISERVIGPSIGADNRDRGIESGIIGLILVVAFMMVYYFVGGAIADAALMLNILFTLAIMAGIRATFTLPGIAGLILTIGMSVDANVLIFERIREEQAKGLGLATAIKNGYQRALSAILDSNLTTILTALILYFVASEDVKGFAIVLMLGIGSSMFTAIFVTRAILDLLVSKRIVKDHLPMLHLVKAWNIDWMRLRPVFFTISGVLVFGGLILFWARGSSKYDIEFTGGTSVQIALKEGEKLTRQDVEDRMVAVAEKLNNADLKSANVYSVGDPIGQADNGERLYSQYEITTAAANKLLTTVTFGAGNTQTVETVAAALRKAQAEAGSDLGDLKVAPGAGTSFVVSTNRVNPTMMQNLLKTTFPQAQVSDSTVQEVVSDAVREAFGEHLAVQQNLQPTIASAEKITEQVVETYPELAPYIGGIKIDTTLGMGASIPEVDDRLKDLKFRPDTQDLASYSYQVFGSNLKPVEAGQPVRAFTFVSVHPEAGLRELSEQEWTQFVNNEKARVVQAAERETSLPRVTQIDPFIGSEARTRAIISIVLSLAAIVAYIWLRFGTLRFGLAAIVACFHDVSVALGAVAISAFLATTFLGQFLLIGDFRINSTVIAAILTLLGYSLNDTIVVFDRIRENRRKVQLTARTVTDSINQTLSRTMITGITTIMVVIIMYIFGGSGLRGFNFVIFLGLIVGTYSSIAVAAPLLLVGLPGQQEKARPAVKIEGVRQVRTKTEGAV